MRSARTSRYRRSTGVPATTPQAPKSCTAWSTTRWAASVANSLAMAASRVTRSATQSRGQAERCGAHGRAEHVEGGHGDLEALAWLAEPGIGRHVAALQPECPERMRGADLDALADRQARR